MPQPPKTNPKTEPQERDFVKDDSWKGDQEKREYYYDDAHGYETYDPDQDEFDEDAPQKNRAIDDDPAN